MKHLKKMLTLAALILGTIVLMPKPAYAYLDPGTGSFILQLLIATAIGAFFSIKVYGKKIVAYLKGLFIKRK